MLTKDNKKFEVPSTFLKNFTKIRTFQLHASQTHINPATKKVQFPRNRAINSYYTIMEGGNVIEFRYWETKRRGTPQSGVEWEYTPDTIDFTSRGNIVLDPAVKEHREICYFLMNHSQFEGSPNRDEKKAVVFFLIDPQKDAQKRMGARDSKRSAENTIMGWSDIALCENAFAFGDLSAKEKTKEELQDFLITVMECDPDGFLKQVNSQELAMKANVVEGKSLGIIECVNKSWTWKDAGEKTGSEICKVRGDEDENIRLVKFFRSSTKDENEEYFMELLEKARVKRDTPQAKEVTVE